MVDKHSYEWGYRNCTPLVSSAGNCNVHTKVKWGVKYHLSDPFKYDLRNCTSYVAWRVNRDYGISIAGWGNANNWDNAAKGKYPIDNKPVVGDIAVWEGGYGHVAFVTKVNSNGTFEVDQFNNAGNGLFSHQLKTSANHFIHVKPAQAPQPPKEVPIPITVIPQVQPVLPIPTPAPITPIPTSLAGTLVPLPTNTSENNGNPMPSTKDIEYLLDYAPDTEEINVFAVSHTFTKSGFIEVNQSSLVDGNSKFQETKTTSLKVRQPNQTKFALADFNYDKKLDLFVIEVQATTSNKTEIVVLDGASNYQKELLNAKTAQPYQDINKVIYKVGDKNNDQKLDIFKISQNQELSNTQFEILDGYTNYQDSLELWKTEDAPSSVKSNYYVGDNDRDGKIDIYQTSISQSDNDQLNIEVFDDSSNYKKPKHKWTLNKKEESLDLSNEAIAKKD